MSTERGTLSFDKMSDSDIRILLQSAADRTEDTEFDVSNDIRSACDEILRLRAAQAPAPVTPVEEMPSVWQMAAALRERVVNLKKKGEPANEAARYLGLFVNANFNALFPGTSDARCTEFQRRAVEKLRHYTLHNSMNEDGESFYPLVDALTPDGMTIDIGDEEIERLVAEVAEVWDDVPGEPHGMTPAEIREAFESLIPDDMLLRHQNGPQILDGYVSEKINAMWVAFSTAARLFSSKLPAPGCDIGTEPTRVEIDAAARRAFDHEFKRLKKAGYSATDKSEVDWFKSGYFAAVRDGQAVADMEIPFELLRLIVKAGRRCAYDLRHAADSVGTETERELFSSRASMWLSVFNPADDGKNYQDHLHGQINALQMQVESLQKKLAEQTEDVPSRTEFLPDDEPPAGSTAT